MTAKLLQYTLDANNGVTTTAYIDVPPGGTVTGVSVVSANGFAGTVATSTTTPAITLSTTITGLLKGNGTAISAASAGTDYVIPAGNVATATLAATVTTNANLTGPVTSIGNATTLASLSTAIKIGTFTRVMNTATGDVSYTGVGFIPSNIIFFGQFTTTGWATTTHGLDNGSTKESITTYGTAGENQTDTSHSIALIDTGNTMIQAAKIKTFDADGFTLTWTLTGAGNAGTANIMYMAFK